MAIISEKLEIIDGFSTNFSKFLEIGTRIADSFDKLNSKVEEYEQKQAKAAEATKKATEAQRAYKSYTEQVAAIQERLNGIMDNVNRQNQRFLESFNKSSSGIEGGIRRLIVAFGGLQAVRGLIGLSDQLSMIQARINSIDVGHVSENMQMIYQAAQRAGGKFLDMADAIAKIKIRAPEAFSSLPQATRFMEILNKQFALSGTDAEGVASTMYNLTQALSLGVLRGSDLKYVMSNLPELGQLLAKEMGVSVSEVKKLAETGQITAEVVKNAVLNAGTDIDERFKNMPLTFGRAMNKLMNTAVYNFQALQKVISNAINSPEFISALNGLSTAITVVTNIGIIGFQKLGEIIKWCSDNMNTLKPIIMGVVGAYVAYNVVAGITSAIMTAHGVLTGIMATAQGMYTAATIAATAGQSAFNAALQACPIVWIIDAIVAVIVVVVALIMALHNLAQTGHTVFGDIAGVIVGCWEVIVNFGKMVVNAFLTAFEAIGNACQEIGYSIATVFYNLQVGAANAFNAVIDGADSAATALANAFVSGANIAIEAINGVIEGLNNIPGVSIGTIGKIGSVGSVFSGKRVDVSAIQAPTKLEPFKLARMETTSMGEAFSKGFEKGSAFGDTAQNKLVDGLKGLTKGLSDLSGGDNGDLSNLIDSNDNLANAMGGGAGGSGGKTNVGTVDKVKDVTLSDEDLKIYRDLAERKYMARLELKQLAPNITVNIPEGQAQLLTPGDIADKLKVMLIEQMSNHTALNYNI